MNPQMVMAAPYLHVPGMSDAVATRQAVGDSAYCVAHHSSWSSTASGIDSSVAAASATTSNAAGCAGTPKPRRLSAFLV